MGQRELLLMRLDTFFKHTNKDCGPFKSIFPEMWVSLLVALLCTAMSHNIDKPGSMLCICLGLFSSIYIYICVYIYTHTHMHIQSCCSRNTTLIHLHIKMF